MFRITIQHQCENEPSFYKRSREGGEKSIRWMDLPNLDKAESWKTVNGPEKEFEWLLEKIAWLQDNYRVDNEEVRCELKIVEMDGEEIVETHRCEEIVTEPLSEEEVKQAEKNEKRVLDVILGLVDKIEKMTEEGARDDEQTAGHDDE